MPVRFKQDSNYVPGVNRARFPITGTGAIRNVGSSLPGSRMPIDSNHVLVYYLNESSGTTITNYGSAAGNNLTISGTATRNITTMYPKGTAATKFNQSPAAYASNNSLSGVPGVAFRSQQAITMELTCAWTSAWSGTEEGFVEIGMSTWPRNFIRISRVSQTSLQFVGYDEGWNRSTSIVTTVPSSSTFCHVAGWWKAAENGPARFFINGVATSATGYLAECSGTPTYIQIGTFSAGQPPYNWVNPASYATNSTIGEVRISNVLRSDAYIQQAYENALNL